MSGDPTKAAQWTGADVYIASDPTTAGPADVTTAWPTGWAPVGLLDGGDGLEESRDEDSKDFYAWGGLLVKSVKSKHKRQWKFSALEDNPTVFALANPGSDRATASGLTTSTIKVPVYAEFGIGVELTDGVTTKRRWAKAKVDKVDTVKETEDSLAVYTITVTIYPDADSTLYHELSGAAA